MTCGLQHVNYYKRLKRALETSSRHLKAIRIRLLLLTKKTQGQRRNTLQKGYILEKSPSIVTMIIVTFIKYQNAQVKNSMAPLPSEILTNF